MTRTIILTTLLALGIVATGFYPIFLPVAMINAVNTVALTFLSFDGLLPILTIFKMIAFAILLEVAIVSYKLFKWIIG